MRDLTEAATRFAVCTGQPAARASAAKTLAPRFLIDENLSPVLTLHLHAPFFFFYIHAFAATHSFAAVHATAPNHRLPHRRAAC